MDRQVIGNGGVIPDNNERWIVGFIHYLGHTSTYMEKLWGLYEDTCLARRIDVVDLKVQINSMMVVQSVTTNNIGNVKE